MVLRNPSPIVPLLDPNQQLQAAQKSALGALAIQRAQQENEALSQQTQQEVLIRSILTGGGGGVPGAPSIPQASGQTPGIGGDPEPFDFRGVGAQLLRAGAHKLGVDFINMAIKQEANAEVGPEDIKAINSLLTDSSALIKANPRMAEAIKNVVARVPGGAEIAGQLGTSPDEIARNLELVKQGKLSDLTARENAKRIKSDAVLQQEVDQARARAEATEASKVRVARAGRAVTEVHVDTGRAQLTKTERSRMIKRAGALDTSLGRLASIEASFDPSLLTYLGRGQTALARVKDKLGSASPEEIKRVRKARRFFQQINTEFNAYRKEITGAAASVRELEDLKEAMINGDLGPGEFQASFETYVSDLRSQRAIAAEMLREGLDVREEANAGEFDARVANAKAANLAADRTAAPAGAKPVGEMSDEEIARERAELEKALGLGGTR